MEDLVATIFTNIVKADSNTDSYDLKDSEGHLYECRTIRLKGTSLIPSKQIGSGREFDEAEHLQKLSWLYGYIFVDIRFMPILTIVAIKSHKLQQKKYITARQFDKLIATFKRTNLSVD